MLAHEEGTFGILPSSIENKRLLAINLQVAPSSSRSFYQ
jgi:hypothetical protein